MVRPGYDIAWITIPYRSLKDSQVTSEYVAYNIQRLAAMSATKKIFVIGHSQGNINIQWALAFWPSVRQHVTGFISLAGDFHGTAEGPLLCTTQNILQGGCSPSVFQQSVGSNYLAAQNAIGGSALVPTTSIYTIFDDIIQPEIINPTSELPGAVNLRIQGPFFLESYRTNGVLNQFCNVLMFRFGSLRNWICHRSLHHACCRWALLSRSKRPGKQWRS
jgi:hypothetical protein